MALNSSADWKFAAEQFVKRLPGKVYVHRESILPAALLICLLWIYALPRLTFMTSNYVDLSKFWDEELDLFSLELERY